MLARNILYKFYNHVKKQNMDFWEYLYIQTLQRQHLLIDEQRTNE